MIAYLFVCAVVALVPFVVVVLCVVCTSHASHLAVDRSLFCVFSIFHCRLSSRCIFCRALSSYTTLMYTVWGPDPLIRQNGEIVYQFIC